MDRVRAKKHLGQHFLKDESIAERIATSLTVDSPNTVLEIGPGMGVLSKYLVKKPEIDFHVVEVDRDSVAYLKKNFPTLEGKIIEGDFLRLKLDEIFDQQFSIIGNFPYNISSQILFKIIDYKHLVPEMVGMFQKEVAERVASKHGSKKYGILSVLLQAYYDIEYLFTVNADVFDPPPKVKSGVIRIVRKADITIPCDAKLLKRIVKTGFNQRRKTLSNSLKSILLDLKPEGEVFRKRPEQLSVEEFFDLTNTIEKLLEENS